MKVLCCTAFIRPSIFQVFLFFILLWVETLLTLGVAFEKPIHGSLKEAYGELEREKVSRSGSTSGFQIKSASQPHLFVWASTH